MALSPGVETQEKDLTFNIRSITSNAGAMIGMFRWGPAEELIKITTDESELANRMGQPDTSVAQHFLCAANYLLYSSPLYIVRALGAGALNAVPTGETAILSKNETDHEDAVVTGLSFFAKYAGDLGNSLKVSCADALDYSNWVYKNNFLYTPTGDQFNMVVVDEDGLISGTAGTVLETFHLLTKTIGSKRTDGTSSYVGKVLTNQSNYLVLGETASIDLVSVSGIYETSFVGGVDDNILNNAGTSLANCIAILGNTESADIVRAFSAMLPASSAASLIDAMDSRQDAIAFVAPELSDVYNVSGSEQTNVSAYFNTTINKNTSYAFYVDNWKLVYDRYNDRNVWIPTDGDAAGLHARVFSQNEPWFSPAGLNRGQLKNVIKLAWNSSKNNRDVLYPDSVNSITAFKGEGTVLFGDKTALKAPSAFDRINVRTLFIVIKEAIAEAARYQLFEHNDIITRTVFTNATERYLANVQGRRGISEFKVKADESNNTAQVIQTNTFVGEIAIRPRYSINFIKLTFSATGADVSFDESEGGQ